MAQQRATQTKSTKAASKSQVTQQPSAQPGPAHFFLRLQQTYGNQAVQSLLREGGLQAKLNISQPGDVHEQEADRVAEQVMRAAPTPAQQPKTGLSESPVVENFDQLAMKREAPLQQVSSPAVSNDALPPLVQEGLRPPGHPLDAVTRGFMEPRFGVGFGHVRIHTDAQAAALARSLNARAFTLGRDVVFGANEHAPETTEGKQLLAHELAHVVQQNRPNKVNAGEFANTGMSKVTALKAPFSNRDGSLYGLTHSGLQIQRQKSHAKKVHKLPFWLAGINAKHVQGNIWEIELTNYGQTFVGPYQELVTFNKSKKLKVDSHHILGSEWLAGIDSEFFKGNAPAVSLIESMHSSVHGAVTWGVDYLGGRHKGRPDVTKQEILAMYRYAYTMPEIGYKELYKIVENIIKKTPANKKNGNKPLDMIRSKNGKTKSKTAKSKVSPQVNALKAVGKWDSYAATVHLTLSLKKNLSLNSIWKNSIYIYSSKITSLKMPSTVLDKKERSAIEKTIEKIIREAIETANTRHIPAKNKLKRDLVKLEFTMPLSDLQPEGLAIRPLGVLAEMIEDKIESAFYKARREEEEEVHEVLQLLEPSLLSKMKSDEAEQMIDLMKAIQKIHPSGEAEEYALILQDRTIKLFKEDRDLICKTVRKTINGSLLKPTNDAASVLAGYGEQKKAQAEQEMVATLVGKQVDLATAMETSAKHAKNCADAARVALGNNDFANALIYAAEAEIAAIAAWGMWKVYIGKIIHKSEIMAKELEKNRDRSFVLLEVLAPWAPGKYARVAKLIANLTPPVAALTSAGVQTALGEKVDWTKELLDFGTKYVSSKYGDVVYAKVLERFGGKKVGKGFLGAVLKILKAEGADVIEKEYEVAFETSIENVYHKLKGQDVTWDNFLDELAEDIVKKNLIVIGSEGVANY